MVQVLHHAVEGLGVQGDGPPRAGRLAGATFAAGRGVDERDAFALGVERAVRAEAHAGVAVRAGALVDGQGRLGPGQGCQQRGHVAGHGPGLGLELVVQQLLAGRAHHPEAAPLAAAGEEAEMAVLQEYLPQQMTRDEIEAEAHRIIEEVGAQGPGDKGKVMPKLIAQLKGKADGREINEVVTELLSS